MSKEIILSVVMPTLNSEKTIEKSLNSLRKQDFDKDSIEILIIDGGSSDKTREISISYGAKIVENPKKLPEIAKHIGIQVAKGKYVMFLDSDEEIVSYTSISRRVSLFETNNIICAIGPTGIKNPKGYPKLSEYINIAGDPFSSFVYRMEGDIYLSSCRKIYNFEDNSGYTKIIFLDSDTLPIGDGGSFTFNLEYLRKKFPEEIKNINFISTLFERAVTENKVLGILENDEIFHYSSTEIGKYLGKIKWRIINNIFYPSIAGAGFSNRKILLKTKIKKYLFIPYGLCIIFPFISSISLVVRKKHPFYLIHTFFAFYTSVIIVWYMIWKILRFSPPKLPTYGK